MKLVLNNITHHDCPVELREKVTFTPEQRRFCLGKMRADRAVSEAVILQTCNRIEFYVYAKSDFDCNRSIAELIKQLHPDAVDLWHRYSQQKEDIDAVHHLFEVAAGLDSQMLGESQVLAQVKSAYTESLESRTSKFVFHRLFHSAFRVGKAVRTDTKINCGAVSVGLAAVELAKKQLDLSAAAAMLIGAGENANLVARFLLKAGLSNLIIANRDKQKAQAIISRLKTGKAIDLDGVAGCLADVDLVVASTAAAEPIVTYQMAEKPLADRTKELLIIDIAVPRDIEPAVGRLDCVSLINIDDLNERINHNKQKRSREIPKARRIVDEFTDKFTAWLSSLNLVPVISQLTQRGMDLAHSEAARYAKDFSQPDSDKLKLFAESLVKKVLHGPIDFIKTGSDEEPTTEKLRAADLINKMFLSQDKRSER